MGQVTNRRNHIKLEGVGGHENLGKMVSVVLYPFLTEWRDAAAVRRAWEPCEVRGGLAG